MLINPVTGAMQLVVFDEQTAPISAETETVVASKIAEGPALYDFLSNKELTEYRRSGGNNSEDSDAAERG